MSAARSPRPPGAATRRRLRIVCRPEVAAGLRLASVPVIEAADAAAAASILLRLADDGATAVVLVEDALHRALPREVRRRLDRRAVPLVAPLPSPAWDARGAAEELIMEILRQAIGYRVRAR